MVKKNLISFVHKEKEYINFNVADSKVYDYLADIVGVERLEEEIARNVSSELTLQDQLDAQAEIIEMLLLGGI